MRFKSSSLTVRESPNRIPLGERRPRAIVIDGVDVALTHGNRLFFSCRGIRECVEYFKHRGHEEILVFVPQCRRETPRTDSPISEQEVLVELEKEGHIVWTPSRKVRGIGLICYNTNLLLQGALVKDAIVVSNNSYEGAVAKNAEYRNHVGDNLLMYAFMNGRFIAPEDPRGRRGPNLATFLCR
ncbi:hypothetical protein L596_008860 [Steinernema carpocapsae]|uniref:RNase NYN domain-containing protein n=1 Tax=Steinernema carpocapsae TaxID=34508 RepID=A0A4V6A6F1_STECR|nr:hypothetical protein L596_008860 [Steinernema carpocapsae]